MNKNLLKSVVFIGLGTLAVVSPSFAEGVGLSGLTENTTSQFTAISTILSGLAYVAGIGFGLKAALKLKQQSESNGQIPLSQPIMLGVVAAILITLPTFLTTGVDTVFGSENSKVEVGKKIEFKKSEIPVK